MTYNVTFNEESQITYRPSPRAVKNQGSIVGLMYSLGVAKTEKDANIFLAGVIVICLIVTATMIILMQPRVDSSRQAELERDFARVNAQVSASSQQSQ